MINRKYLKQAGQCVINVMDSFSIHERCKYWVNKPTKNIRISILLGSTGLVNCFRPFFLFLLSATKKQNSIYSDDVSVLQ